MHIEAKSAVSISEWRCTRRADGWHDTEKLYLHMLSSFPQAIAFKEPAAHPIAFPFFANNAHPTASIKPWREPISSGRRCRNPRRRSAR